MKHCAFLTLNDRGDFVIDDELAVGPLNRLGWRVSTVSWRQLEIPWSDFDAVVVRSTWDYWDDVPAFLEVLAGIDRVSRLANPLDVIHWNLAKSYLRDLEGKGIEIVPTVWPDGLSLRALESWSGQLGSDELVVKPVIGANGEDAFRISAQDDRARLTRIEERFRGRDALVQRFMSNITSEGEYSLFFFAGEFSHAILKVPAAAEFRSQEERGAAVHSVMPETRLLERGRQALSAIASPLLYARIDFVRNEFDDFAVMELELIEPSMYLRTDSGAPARFARAIDAWFGERPIPG